MYDDLIDVLLGYRIGLCFILFVVLWAPVAAVLRLCYGLVNKSPAPGYILWHLPPLGALAPACALCLILSMPDIVKNGGNVQMEDFNTNTFRRAEKNRTKGEILIHLANKQRIGTDAMQSRDIRPDEATMKFAAELWEKNCKNLDVVIDERRSARKDERETIKTQCIVLRKEYIRRHYAESVLGRLDAAGCFLYSMTPFLCCVCFVMLMAYNDIKVVLPTRSPKNPLIGKTLAEHRNKIKPI